MTNFERIKAMDKEEMVDFLDDVAVGEYDFIQCNGFIPAWLDMDCTEPIGIDYWITRQQEDFMRMVQDCGAKMDEVTE